ncbi:hypothetical protein, partial [Ferrovibrio sp.]|uniref:hypothetical protein n=1 Tax=Ferrovibrio sp. TaxID=1917215 RepID=UPI00311DBE3C
MSRSSCFPRPLLAAGLAVALAAWPVAAVHAVPADRFSAPLPSTAAPLPDPDTVRRQAEAGDREAQFRMGLASQHGIGLGIGNDR